jgi:hypothetical protein
MRLLDTATSEMPTANLRLKSEEKAVIIRRIFQQFVYGVSIKLIMEEAVVNGLSHSGKSACIKILRNSVYASLLKILVDNDMLERMVKAIHPPIIREVSIGSTDQEFPGKK